MKVADSKPRRNRSCQHCSIWSGGDGWLSILCAHCGVGLKEPVNVASTTPAGLLKRQIAASRSAHLTLCTKLKKGKTRHGNVKIGRWPYTGRT